MLQRLPERQFQRLGKRSLELSGARRGWIGRATGSSTCSAWRTTHWAVRVIGLPTH